MANKKFKKLGALKDFESDTGEGKFGSYKEEKGGGTPRGGVWGGENGRVGWKTREASGELPQGAHRQEQPRTDDGKFTYNSVNGKETKYESRGKTVNPLLSGGENGIYIDDVKRSFSNKKGKLYDRFSKMKVFQRGTELVTKEGKKYVVKLSREDIWDIMRRSFNISTQSFDGEDTNWSYDKDPVTGLGSTKRGRRSSVEQEAIAKAKKAGEETFVTSGGEQVQKQGMGSYQAPSTGIKFTISPGVIANFRKVQAVRNAALNNPNRPVNPNLHTNTAATMGGQSAFVGGANALKNTQNTAFKISPTAMNNALASAAKILGVTFGSGQTPQVNSVAQKANKPKVSLKGFFNK